MKICIVKDCNRKHRTKGFCQSHYSQYYKSQFKCKIEECTGNYLASGYCSKHYFLFKKYGNPFFRSTRAKGEGTIREKDGYKITAKNHKAVYEHRAIMENHLGRSLAQGEIVHHKDGNTSNNSIDNLLLTDRHIHMSFHKTEKIPCIICGDPWFCLQFCKLHYHQNWRKNHSR